ncbi:methyl-accepting chemotaxis protein [Maridesulfovibrio sp.]|uniref:methyl-accepting chemotaxis protein n=1 Tax=Maridesulfovibrio sp. TaxID=2795000 RepID=UPI002A189C48|nr:methyl-accepting chemotaxis protein [Maridesulfovibrio sp.]
MRFSLRRKIITIACGAAIIPIMVMFFITNVLEDRLQVCLQGEVRSLIETHISQLTRDLYDECRASSELLMDETRRASVALQTLLQESGAVEVSKMVSDWPLHNPRGEDETEISVPVMSMGGVKLVYSERKNNPLPVLVEASSISGAYCTVYQRINPEGDMLVVDTTAPEGAENSRPGDIFYSLGKDGKASTVIDDVLSGRTVEKFVSADHGTRFVVYSPLRDKDNFITGMLAVHMDDNIVAIFRKSMLKTTIGKTGYVWAIGTRGKNNGKYVVAGSPAQDGRSVDAAGGKKEFADSLIEQAVSAGEGKLSSMEYLWKTEKDDKERQKIAVFTYYKPWGWVIGSCVPLDEYQGITNRLEGVLDYMVQWLTAAGIVLLVITLSVSLWVSGLIANPVSRMVDLVKVVAEGDLFTAKNKLAEIEQECSGARHAADNRENDSLLDETGQLYLAMKNMVDNLFSLVAQVQRSGIQVTTSSTEIAASARQLDVTFHQQAAATNQISATSTEISANSMELAGTMHLLNDSASGMGALASDGQDGLRTMIRIMDELSQGTASITGKLAEINDRANSIVGIVSTITKVADRTNLLSLNAAIEAEKAGKFGQGFSVVAEEIRRLADQTSVAALEIENMIGNMRISVDSGVEEMDKFAADVRLGASKAGKLGKKLDGIMVGVRDLTPRIEVVNEGMSAQAEGAEQISEAMSQLSETASDTSDALGEFNRAAGQLNEAVQGLRGEVSRFKVSE